jgi:hypothetical protein
MIRPRFPLALILVAGLASLVVGWPGAVATSPADPAAPLICPPPAAPSSFWGYVTLNGAPAPVGLKLAAWVNGVEVASTTTQTSGSKTYYLIDVLERAYDTVTGQVCRQGGAAGETVHFVLRNLITAHETGTWSGGTQVHRDLTATRFVSYLPIVLRR